MADQASQARGRGKLRCLAKLVVVSGTAFRNSIRAHAGAGCLAVAGIAGLGSAYLIPFIIRASSRGFRDAAVSAALILLGTVSLSTLYGRPDQIEYQPSRQCRRFARETGRGR